MRRQSFTAAITDRVLLQVVGDSILTSVRVTWADGIDYFVDKLLNGEPWQTASSGNAVDYWPGVAEDPNVNLLSDFSSRVSFDSVLDVQDRLASMRQGIAPGIFCGPMVMSEDNGGETVGTSAYVDRSGPYQFMSSSVNNCSTSQLNAEDSACCASDFHTLVEMNYLVDGGYYPAETDTKWGTVTRADGGWWGDTTIHFYSAPMVCTLPFYYLAGQGGTSTGACVKDVECPYPYYFADGVARTATSDTEAENVLQECVHDEDPHDLPGWIRAVMVAFPLFSICLVSSHRCVVPAARRNGLIPSIVTGCMGTVLI